MESLGLVFCGGGGRGSYQIGVWKALDELGITKQIKAVSGTSVGALNAALFASKTRKEAADIWSSINQNDIISEKEFKEYIHDCKNLKDIASNAINSKAINTMVPLPLEGKSSKAAYKISKSKVGVNVGAKALEKEAAKATFKTLSSDVLVGTGAKLLEKEGSKTAIKIIGSKAIIGTGTKVFVGFGSIALTALPLAAKMIKTAVTAVKAHNTATHLAEIPKRKGFFSQDGLKRLIKENNIEDDVKKSPITCFACRIKQNESKSKNKPEYVPLNDLSEKGEIIEALADSSCLPKIFHIQDHNGEKYRDGGVIDNCPIYPLYNDVTYKSKTYSLRLRKIIVVMLNPSETFDETKYPDAEFIVIKPNKSIYLGHTGIKYIDDGLLDFKADHSLKRMKLGYKDTIDVFEKLGYTVPVKLSPSFT